MALQDKNSFADVWEQLDAKYAERVRVTDAAALGDEEIVRRWPQIGEGYLSKCLTALSLFTDSKNSKPQLWVKDPVVGRETFPGTYRVVTVDVDVQKPGLKGIIQTLRKGFAESPQWTEARIEETEDGFSNTSSVAGISGTASDSMCRFLTIKFPNCSPNAVEAICASLRSSATISGVVVANESYAGTWDVVRVGSKIEEDGSGTVTLVLAHPQYTLNAYDSFGTERAVTVHYLYDVPKPQAQSIITAWKSANPVGSSATASYSRSNGLVDIILRVRAQVEKEVDVGRTSWNCRYSETQDMYLGVSSGSAYPLTIMPANGVSYERNVRSNGDGTFDIIITTKTAQYRDATGLTVEQSAAQSTVQRQQLGLTTQAVEPMAEATGVIKTQRVEIRDDCSKDIVTQTETGKPMVSVSKTVSAGETETTEEKTYQADPLPDPPQVDGHIKTVKNAASKYPGMYETASSDREVSLLTAGSGGGGPLYTEETVVSKNATEDLSGEAPGEDGTIVSASSSKNMAGRFDNSKTVRTAVEKSKTSISGGPLVVETVVVRKNGEAQSPGAGGVGTINDASNSINEFGRVDSTFVKRVAVEKSVSVATGGGLVSEQLTVTKNGSVPAPGSGGAGVITDASASVNEFGKVDSTVSIKTAKTATATSVSGGPLAVETEVVTKNGEAQSPGAGGIGTINRVGQSVNEFGKVDSQVSTIVAVQSAPARSTHGSALVKVETETVKNGSAVSPGQGAVGQIIDVNQSVNEFGKIDSTSTRKTALQLTVPETDAGGDAFESVRSSSKLNQSSDGGAARVLGKVVDATSSVNEFGLIDQRIKTRTPVPVTDGPTVIHDDGYKRTSLTRYRNAEAAPTVSGKGQDADFRKNEFGKFDGQLSSTEVTKFNVDVNEPATSGKHPGFQRTTYGIESAALIQSEVDAFVARAAAVVDEQFHISVGVSRDSDGFYIVHMSAKPKESGGSVQNWDAGLVIEGPICEKRSKYTKIKETIQFSLGRSSAESFLNGGTNPVEGTTAFYIGRGRYKAVRYEGSD